MSMLTSAERRAPPGVILLLVPLLSGAALAAAVGGESYDPDTVRLVGAASLGLLVAACSAASP